MTLYTIRVLPQKEYPGITTKYFVDEKKRDYLADLAKQQGYTYFVGTIETED